MAISKEQVEHVASLSKLQFSDEEVEKFTHQLAEIMDMIDQLDEVDTEGVAVTTNVIHDMNLYREDKPVKGTDRDELMKNVPMHENGYIKVPAMLDNGGED